MKNNDIMKTPVDVICYGKRKHYDTREEAITFYQDGMSLSEGAEQERYTTIYLALINSASSVVSDGEPELKEKPKGKPYTIDDKQEILKKIKSGELSMPSSELYDFRTGNLHIADRDVIRALLMKDGGYAAQYLRKYIENDKELIKTAGLGGKERRDTLSYAGEELRDDKAFVLEMIGIKSSNFGRISDRLKNDPEVVAVALKQATTDLELKIIKENIGTELLKNMVSAFVTKQKGNTTLDNMIQAASTGRNNVKSNSKNEKEIGR
ncbi:MAG: hypothetical protein IJ274_07550 [Lachnospiraceae bacterium]|nr:hypothetical protein [Lachnospiraceae bacterium]